VPRVDIDPRLHPDTEIYKEDIHLDFERIKVIDPNWQAPKVHVRVLEEGEIPFDWAEDNSDWYNMDSEEEEEISDLAEDSGSDLE
jgi:hypothetical protein